ncbi:LrgB family protein [Sinobaca sp. H24]|uniref:LrgB family protein n=1 Tax=Sinobaca sp. H24 TaxID=2923376 RepID=UPI0035B17F4C
MDPRWIQEGTALVLRNMPLIFLGDGRHYAVLFTFYGSGIWLVGITLVSTFIVMALAGVTAQQLMGGSRNMNNVITAVLMIMLTVGMYIAAKQLYKRFPSPFTLPVLIGTLLIIGVLEAGNIAYPVYMEGGRWIEYFLGPAVVSLAYPLYSQRKLLRRYFIPILCSSAVGAAAGTASGWGLSILVTNEQELLASVLPKSVTAPIAMSVAESLDGIAALAAVFVMIAGIGG